MRQRHSLAALFIFVTVLVVGCGTQAGAAPAVPNDPGSEHPAVGAIPSGGGERAVDEDAAAGGGEDGGPGSPAGDAAPIEQRIVKTGEVALEVDSVPGILARVRAIADELGGYVGGSQAGTLDESASLTLRVPADRFDELLARLHELEEVEVISESTTEQDVTREIVDLEARIRNLEASEESYRVLLERAEEVDDVLAVQSRLDQVRGQIEQLEGQLQTIEGQADLSTLTVTIIPRGEPVQAVQATWDPGAELESAIAALVGFGQGLLEALIWLVVVWVPILLALALVGVVVLRGAIEVRRRWPLEQKRTEADPMR